MVTIGRVHVGDYKTDFRLRIYDTQLDGTNNLVDLTAVDTAQMIFTDPDFTESTVTATKLTPLANGIISYLNVDVTLNQSGPWYYRGKLTYADGGIFQTNDAFFNVLGSVI